MTTCTLPECARPHFGLGFCKRHYNRIKKYGNPDTVMTTAKLLDDTAIIEQYLTLKLDTRTIAANFGVSQTCVLNHLRRLNVPLRRSGHNGLPLESNPNWKGGSTDRGYVLVMLPPDHPLRCMCDPKGYIRRNRLVVATHLGRPLLDAEIVHHKDEDKQNDSLGNLELLPSQSVHMKEHMTSERAKMMQRKQQEAFALANGLESQ